MKCMVCYVCIVCVYMYVHVYVYVFYSFTNEVCICHRYTLFIPLYPTGVLGELGTLYISIPYVGSIIYLNNIFGPHFPYRYMMYILMVIWPIAWWPVYMHMFRQRKSKLGGAVGTSTKKTN